MKKFILILFLALISFSCKSQYPNFFWSYPQQNYTTIHYGALYNWYAATDSRKITSSDDWSVPTYNKLSYVQNLLTYNNGGKYIKESGSIYWYDGNTGTNQFNFNARGSGHRGAISQSPGGVFLNIKNSTYYWSSTETDSDGAWALGVIYFGTPYLSMTFDVMKVTGFPIRLFRNCTTEELSLPDGAVSATYTGNNLKVYRCCKIGNYIITADNLAETKFRNGDWIPGFDGGTYTPISNATWAASTSAMMCIYNDNISNL